MTRYLLDTNHASRLFRDDQKLWIRVRTAADAEFSFCRPSVGELWFMVLNSLRVQENRVKLEGMLRRFQIRELDEASAIEYGAIRVELRGQGTPIPQIDTQIAAIARVNDLMVLSADRHFSRVQSLRVGNWL